MNFHPGTTRLLVRNHLDMGQSEVNHFETLKELPKNCSLPLLEEYVSDLLKRRTDTKVAVEELDNVLAVLQNHLQLMSLYLKQRYLLWDLVPPPSPEIRFYTKQEIANKYRVSVRTVTNWIIDGLEVEEVGGIKRISFESVERFKKSVKGKKFSWKSIRRN